MLYPYRVQVAVEASDAAVTTVTLADADRALSWLTTEQPVLLAMIDQAAATGFDAHASRLAWTVTAFLNYQGHWDDWAASLRAALAACRRLDDRSGQALAHRLLNVAYQHQDRLDEADAHARQALSLFAHLDDHAGQARIHLDLGRMLERQGHSQRALDHARQALDLYRLAADRAGEADALNAVGRYHSRLGYHEQALAYCDRSLALHAESAAWPGFQADTWHSLGYAHHQLGHHGEAVRCYQRALDLWGDLDDRYEVATVLVRLGDTHRAVGDQDAARSAWRRAWTIFEELGHPEAEHLRIRIDAQSDSG